MYSHYLIISSSLASVLIAKTDLGKEFCSGGPMACGIGLIVVAGAMGGNHMFHIVSEQLGSSASLSKHRKLSRVLPS